MKAPTAADAEKGFVEPGFDSGEVFVKVSRETYRLVWKKGDKDRRRALPIGEHKITGYRISRTAKDGSRWILSTTSPGYRKVTIQSGKTVKLGIRAVLRCNFNIRGKPGRKRAGMVFLGQGRTGITLYRNGKRIPMAVRLVNRRGRPSQESAMQYG